MIAPTPRAMAAVRQSGHMRLISLFLISAFIAFGQATDGIGTSVTRTVTLTADQADFSMVAGAGLDVTQQQVTQVFLDAGISSLTLTGTSLGQSYDYSTNTPSAQTQILYQFAFSVPAGGLKDATKKLETLRTNLPVALKSLQYTAALDASQTTVDAMHQTLLPQLFADAQKKAQALATAAGLKLGAIKGVSESVNAAANYLNWIGSSSFSTGPISGGSGAGTQYTFYTFVTFSVAAQ